MSIAALALSCHGGPLRDFGAISQRHNQRQKPALASARPTTFQRPYAPTRYVVMNRVPLEQEQEELLAIMVEASRAVPRDQRHEFLFLQHFGGCALVHQGMAAI